MQSDGGSTTSHLPVAPPKPISIAHDRDNPSATLSFPSAAPNQILRAYQRDGSHLQRFSDLVAELLRSAAGSRWLARKQLYIEMAVKTIYLSLTLGRSVPTFGEEYTDIAPQARQHARITRLRRLVAICLLVLPTAFSSPSMLAMLRPRDSLDNGSRTGLQRLGEWTATLLESPMGQSLPEISTIAFLYGGRFLELGRRLTGLSYISTSTGRPGDRPSYEPVSLLLLLPLCYRLLQRYGYRESTERSQPAITPTRGAGESEDKTANSLNSTAPNTYLNHDARDRVERQCTLCLEPRGSGGESEGAVAVTECGHAFCWGCLARLDKAECPLCRQSLRMERLIAAYNL